jgi:hypothetical protein
LERFGANGCLGSNREGCKRDKMKNWTVGELQAFRGATRFMLGIGALALIISGCLLVLTLKLTPEERNGDVHRNDIRDGSIILVLSACSVVAGWKLRSFVKKWESQTGRSAKPFGWVP